MIWLVENRCVIGNPFESWNISTFVLLPSIGKVADEKWQNTMSACAKRKLFQPQKYFNNCKSAFTCFFYKHNVYKHTQALSFVWFLKQNLSILSSLEKLKQSIFPLFLLLGDMSENFERNISQIEAILLLFF